MENIKRIFHAKDSITKIAYFHNEIIKCLKEGYPVAVVNMSEFETMGDSRIMNKSINDIPNIPNSRVVFIFELYPHALLLETLNKLENKRIYITISDFSVIYTDLFNKIGFEVYYIKDNYITENTVYGSFEELNAAVLKTFN